MDEITRAIREENRLRREEWRQRERDKPRQRAEQQERNRRRRWAAAGRARVVSIRFGETVVPCASRFAALLCAAEVWRCDWAEIRDAQVWAAGPAAETTKGV